MTRPDLPLTLALLGSAVALAWLVSRPRPTPRPLPAPDWYGAMVAGMGRD